MAQVAAVTTLKVDTKVGRMSWGACDATVAADDAFWRKCGTNVKR